MEYCIKNIRLATFLSTLGFNYRQVPNKYIEKEFVYLFSNTESLHEAITFYTKFHQSAVTKFVSKCQ